MANALLRRFLALLVLSACILPFSALASAGETTAASHSRTPASGPDSPPPIDPGELAHPDLFLQTSSAHVLLTAAPFPRSLGGLKMFSLAASLAVQLL